MSMWRPPGKNSCKSLIGQNAGKLASLSQLILREVRAEAPGPLCGAGAQNAGFPFAAAFQLHRPRPPGDPVCGLCAVVDAQRLQLPIRTGEDLNPAVPAHQNCKPAILCAILPSGL